MSAIKHIIDRYKWIRPESRDSIDRVTAHLVQKDAPLSDDDLRFISGVLLAGRQDQDSDPADTFQAQQAGWSALRYLLNHALWQAAQIASLKASTPGDTQDLIEARKRITELERAVEAACFALNEVNRTPT